MATDARSVWVEVEYRRPFSGVQSVTTLSFRRPPSATTFNFFRTTLSCDPPSGSAQSFRIELGSLAYDLRELASSIIF